VNEEGDDTVYVLNVLWFRPGGSQRYRDYIAAARPLVEARGGAFLEPYEVAEAWQGDLDADLVFYGRYPSKEVLLEMLTSDEYQRVATIRDEAVERSITSLCRAAPPFAD
jgi:uncharacterized protein (DUF1330 family)